MNLSAGTIINYYKKAITELCEISFGSKIREYKFANSIRQGKRRLQLIEIYFGVLHTHKAF